MAFPTRSTAKAALDIVAKVMTENPNMTITVMGHNNEEEEKAIDRGAIDGGRSTW